MSDEEVQALVVDNGSGMCKAGFAGDDAPRAGKWYTLSHKSFTAATDLYQSLTQFPHIF